MVSKNVDFEELPEPTLANGDNYTIDPNNTVTATNAVAQLDFTDIADKLKKNSVINITLLESSQIGGTTNEPCFQANINLVKEQLILILVLLYLKIMQTYMTFPKC